MKNNKHYAYHSPFNMVDSEGIEYTLKVETDDCAECRTRAKRVLPIPRRARRCSKFAAGVHIAVEIC